MGLRKNQLDINTTCLPIVENIEEALKSSKADPSIVNSARSSIIGTLNKPIRHNPNLSTESVDRLGLCLIGLFKVTMIRALAEETVDGSAFDDFSASSMLAIISSTDYCQHRRSTEIIKS